MKAPGEERVALRPAERPRHDLSGVARSRARAEPREVLVAHPRGGLEEAGDRLEARAKDDGRDDVSSQPLACPLRGALDGLAIVEAHALRPSR
jgi:hypothetical protein